MFFLISNEDRIVLFLITVEDLSNLDKDFLVLYLILTLPTYFCDGNWFIFVSII